MNTSGQVIVTVDRRNPPYVRENGGELTGHTVDLLREVFASCGVTVAFDPVDGPLAQSLHVSAGRADAAADFTVTERRSRWFQFSHRYHLEELQVFTLRHGPIWPGWGHFRGLLAVKTDSYAHEYLIRHHRHVRLSPVDSTERLLAMLREGRVAGAVMSRVTGLALLGDDSVHDLGPSGAPFGPAPLALAALPEREAVLAQFNAGLALAGNVASRFSPFRRHV